MSTIYCVFMYAVNWWFWFSLTTYCYSLLEQDFGGERYYLSNNMSLHETLYAKTFLLVNSDQLTYFILPSFLLSVYGGFTVVSLHELVNKFKYHIVCSPDSQLLRIFDLVVNKFKYHIVCSPDSQLLRIFDSVVNKFIYYIVCSPDSQLLRIFDSVVNKLIYYIVSNLTLPLRIALLTLCC